MKQGKLFLSVIGIALLLLPFVTALNASAYDLQVSQGENGYYWGTSPEGYQIGCGIEEISEWDNDTESYKYSYRPYVNGFKDATVKTVTLPESITVTVSDNYPSLIGQSLSISTLGREGNYDYIAFNNTDVCNIIIPANYTQVRIESTMSNVIFKGTTPPTIIMYEYNSSRTRFIVPALAFDTYEKLCVEESQGWTPEMNLLSDNYRDDKCEVEVKSPGSLEEDLLSKCSSFDKVYNLTIKGSINGRDLNVFAKLKNLTTLDLSGTNLNSIRGCNDRLFLETVVLPESILVIDGSAFSGCKYLKSINTDNVITISSDAFYDVLCLESIILDKVETIGSHAFSLCNLESVSGDRVKEIGGEAFSNCRALKSVNFPNVVRIGSYAFSGTDLKDFMYLRNVDYGSGCVYGSKVEKIYVCDNRKIDDFNGHPYLTDVYLFDPIPSNRETVNSQTVIPRLYVPGFSFESYIDHPNYYGFDKVLKLDEDLVYLDVYRDLHISSNEDLGSKFDLLLRPESYRVTLENNAEQLTIGDFVQYYQLSSSSYDYTTLFEPSTTFINNGIVTAENVKVVMNLRNSRDLWSESGWNFISFPYDVNIEDIITPSEALWVVREYDGAIRASRSSSGDTANTQSAWSNVTKPAVLKAGKGYILHFSSNYGDTFTFPAVNNENKNKIFSNNDVSIPLAYYPAPEKFEHDDSWNLIGNPYDACFDTHQITDSKSTSQVITVWRSRDWAYDAEGNQRYGTYETFSLVDDDYVLAPFEAFFVQATGENTNLTFHKEGRQHNFTEKKNQHHAPRRMIASNNDRAIINLHIEANGLSDRTRLVINEEASTNYEIGFDASKFLTPDANVPQIYMIQDGQNLAINERPMGTGMFRVGTVFGADGSYTLTTDMRNADYSIILFDAETGIETDITKNGYTFNANGGIDNSRFSIRLKIGESGVDNVKTDNFNVTINAGNLSVTADGEINVFSIDGNLVASGNDNLEISLSKGIYVVKAAGQTKKVTY